MISRKLAVTALTCVCVASVAPIAHGEAAWTTYHRDAGRSGYDPDGANPLIPALAWQSAQLGAPIWSQPLVLGSRVYVATVGNDVYALDAATGAVAWMKNAGPPVPSSKLPCGDIEPEVGIVGTPVIDPLTNAIYAVADVWDEAEKEAHHELVGYSLANGEQVLRTRIDPPGVGRNYLQRAALNLDTGSVIVAMGGNYGDCETYRGTLFSVPENGEPPTSWQVPIKVKTESGGAVWAASGPAVDAEGEILASTGNPNPAGGEKATVYDYSDSLVELSRALSLIGWFEPPTWEADSNSDSDLGSAGPELLPAGLVFQAGKNGTGYLVDPAAMATGADAVFSGQVCGGAESFGGDAYHAGVIYVACSNGIQALSYDEAGRSFSPIWHGPSDAAGPPIVSAGSVWVVATHAKPENKLYGLDPATGVVRYTETLPSAAADHFASPSAAGGRLFVASGTTVTAFQIAQPTASPPMGPPAPPRESPPSESPRSLAGASPAIAGTSGVSPATLVGRRATVSRSGRFRVKVRCASGVSVCHGKLFVRSRNAVIARTDSRGRAARARAAVRTLASGTFNVPGGRVKTVKLRLAAWARRLLIRHRSLRTTAAVTMPGPTGAQQTAHAALTLRLARRG